MQTNTLIDLESIIQMNISIDYVSDIHLEMIRPSLREDYCASLLKPSDSSILVMAGDICPLDDLYVEDFSAFTDRYDKVYHLAGNHEWYGVKGDKPKTPYREGNYVFIPGPYREKIEDMELIFAPLFYDPYLDKRLFYTFSDSIAIRDSINYISDIHHSSMAMLKSMNKRAKTVVITHHAPSVRSVAPKYAGDNLNCFFYCDLESLISEKRPKAWIHGHMHDSVDYYIEKTHVVSNPIGYPSEVKTNASIKTLVI